MTTESNKASIGEDAGLYHITHSDAYVLHVALNVYKKQLKKGKVGSILFVEDELDDTRRLKKLFKEGKEKYAIEF